MEKSVSWKKFKEQCWWDDESGFRIDYSRMGFSEGFISRMEPAIVAALEQMTALGSYIQHPRQGVTHGTLRQSRGSKSRTTLASMNAGMSSNG